MISKAGGFGFSPIGTLTRARDVAKFWNSLSYIHAFLSIKLAEVRNNCVTDQPVIFLRYEENWAPDLKIGRISLNFT